MSVDTDPLALARARQREASDALASVWVSASAGTGKTTVLTDRVLALLVSNPDLEPHKVLCLTFTRAASAEMASRIAKRLGDWAFANDADLERELTGLIGHPPSDTQKKRARHLLASVLDAPGGMTIMTIHAFCQSLLRRFPLEARIAPHFALIEERDAADMLADVREEVLAQALDGGDPLLADALLCITRHVADGERFDGLLASLTGARAELGRMIESAGGIEPAVAALYRLLRVELGATPDSIAEAAAEDSAFDAIGLRKACAILAAGKKTDAERGALIAAWLAKPGGLDGYLPAFLTNDRTIRKTLLTKELADKNPEVAAALAAEAARLEKLCRQMRAAEVARSSAALLRLGNALLARYAERKRHRGLLDYDDLIAAAVALLKRPGIAPWVLFKLDGGIDHILIDEAQDTSPMQWSIVEALAEEFFAGLGTRETTRTVFAVGDVKQSIYSFQGADPESFVRMRGHFDAQVNAAGQRWRPVELDVSFRSTSAVLQAVDAVFAQAHVRDGVALDDQEIRHLAARAGAGGLVELWPAVKPQEAEGPPPWKPPVERIRAEAAETRLARLIAKRIHRMVASREILDSTGQPIRAGDIMVLVRRRTGFVEDLVRALKDLEIKVAGVDRMRLAQQIAVMDLIALGRVALLPEDDLTLATVLKGPLFGFTEDELFALAHDRRGRLWDALRDRAAESEVFARAHDGLAQVMARADRLAPYEFYTEILSGRLRGRERLLARLGPDALDPIAEFVNLALAYEQSHVPTLEGFLHWVEQGDVEIKRDLEHGARDAVRVLTAHGAKGLEAPIVFLPDTLQMPRALAPFYWPAGADGAPCFLWPPKSALREDICEAEHARLKELQEQEYRRLLYVAMTRARDRLYICGWEGKATPPAGCWYNLVKGGLEGVAETAEDSFLVEMGETEGAQVLRLASPQSVAPQREKEEARYDLGALAAWARETPPPEATPPRPLAPSRPEGEEPPVQSPLGVDLGQRFRRGRIVHALLQTLPDVPQPERAGAARRYLAQPALGLDAVEQTAVAAEVLAVIEAPEHAFLFGPASRAEVPLVGQVGDTVISAQLDRLAVTEDAVHLVDFKSNRPPPARAEDVAPIYLKQMAIYREALRLVYPDKRIVCYLLWTDGARLMPLSEAQLTVLEPAT